MWGGGVERGNGGGMGGEEMREEVELGGKK